MHEHTTKIRDHINGPRLSHLLRKDLGKWNQLCSSLDVIEDTALAIDAYTAVDASALPRNYGARYLALYGLLQALFLQQDAAAHLCESLGIPFNMQNYPRLGAIRDVRNASIGHPTKKGWKSHRSHHFISRISLGKRRFTLLSAYPRGNDKFNHIDVSELVDHQLEDLSDVLATVVAELDKRAEDHRVKFMNERLADAFPETMGYAFEKLGEAARESKPREMGLWTIETVEQAMNDFRDGLTRQDMELDTFEVVKYLYEELGYALPELKKYLQGDNGDVRNERMARIVTFFIYHKVGELRGLAREIDEDGDGN